MTPTFRNNMKIRVTDKTSPFFYHEGVVTRLLTRDNSAWVKLTTLSPTQLLTLSIHLPFPANDEHGRGTHVNLWPEQCEAI